MTSITKDIESAKIGKAKHKKQIKEIKRKKNMANIFLCIDNQ